MIPTWWLYAKYLVIAVMQRLPILIMFLLVISTAPVYAQNTNMDEKELQIRAEILECEEKIAADEQLSAAEKTVNQRKCSAEIRTKYADTPMTAKTQNDVKIKLQDLQRCDDWHSSYKFLDEATFRLQKNAQIVTSCIALYNDQLWKYDGEDRQEILAEKLAQIKSATPVKTNLSDEFLKDPQIDFDRIQNLEKKIAELENEIKNKNMIIQEQVSVIVNLANTLKNAVFDGITSLYSFA